MLPNESSAAAIDPESNQIYLDNIASAACLTGADELIDRLGK